MIHNLEELVRHPQDGALRQMRRDALTILDEAIRAADAAQAVRKHLTRQGDRLEVNGHRIDLGEVGHIRLVALGKASVAMSRALLERVSVEEGLVVAHAPTTEDLRPLDFLQAGHPHPDEASFRAGRHALDLAHRCGPEDLLFVLVSGGGSSLLEATNLPEADLRRTSKMLHRSGMTILAQNTIRKHLSLLKGGQLAQAATREGGQVVALIVSDVVGDPLSFIASGPTVPDESTYADAQEALAVHGLWDQVPLTIRERIEAGRRGEHPETPKSGEGAFARVVNQLIATNRGACEAAVAEAESRGYRALLLSSELQGEARDVGRFLADLGRALATKGLPLPAPAALVAGGETTVTVRGSGIGGRSQELVLAALEGLQDQRAVLLSAGTDGRDGETEAAGAVGDGESWRRSRSRGLDPEASLEANDSHPFFRALGDTILTGPTGTNVMDLQILLVR